MSTLTNAGRAFLANAIKATNILVGWGSGQAQWDTQHLLENTLFDTDGKIITGYTEIDFVKLRPTGNAPGDGEFVEGVDYTINRFIGIVTRTPSGGIAVDDALDVEFYVKPASPDVTQVTLQNPVGYKKVLVKSFVVPDPDGTILDSVGQKFSVSLTPTPHLYLSVTFAPNEAPTAFIRELAVFLNAVTDSGLPSGQLYFTPVQVTDVGTMFSLTNRRTIQRTNTSEETFNFVITL